MMSTRSSNVTSGNPSEPLAVGSDYQKIEEESKNNDDRTAASKSQQEDNIEFSPDDAEIQRDAANDRVAFIVHLALIFFASLVVVAAALCSIVVAKFGLIAFGFMGLLVLLFVSLIAFVNKVLRDDAKLKPVRRQLQRWQAVATAVVLQEMRNFQLDWHEHLLLTDGKIPDEDEQQSDNEEDIHATLQQAARGKRGKSVVFRLVVKPFLTLKGRRRRRKQAQTDSKPASEPGATYVAPSSET